VSGIALEAVPMRISVIVARDRANVKSGFARPAISEL
jgi:hypothetical protein